jgi:hypothetical protein
MTEVFLRLKQSYSNNAKLICGLRQAFGTKARAWPCIWQILLTPADTLRSSRIAKLTGKAIMKVAAVALENESYRHRPRRNRRLLLSASHDGVSVKCGVNFFLLYIFLVEGVRRTLRSADPARQ